MKMKLSISKLYPRIRLSAFVLVTFTCLCAQSKVTEFHYTNDDLEASRSEIEFSDDVEFGAQFYELAKDRLKRFTWNLETSSRDLLIPAGSFILDNEDNYEIPRFEFVLMLGDYMVYTPLKFDILLALADKKFSGVDDSYGYDYADPKNKTKYGKYNGVERLRIRRNSLEYSSTKIFKNAIYSPHGVVEADFEAHGLELPFTPSEPYQLKIVTSVSLEVDGDQLILHRNQEYLSKPTRGGKWSADTTSELAVANSRESTDSFLIRPGPPPSIADLEEYSDQLPLELQYITVDEYKKLKRKSDRETRVKARRSTIPSGTIPAVRKTNQPEYRVSEKVVDLLGYRKSHPCDEALN